MTFLLSQERTSFPNSLSDMMAAVVKKKLDQCNIRNLIERRGTNVKDNLLKNTYNLYSLGEKSIQVLPKNMLRCDKRLQNQEVQMDSCLSSMIFASVEDVENWCACHCEVQTCFCLLLVLVILYCKFLEIVTVLMDFYMVSFSH